MEVFQKTLLANAIMEKCLKQICLLDGKSNYQFILFIHSRCLHYIVMRFPGLSAFLGIIVLPRSPLPNEAQNTKEFLEFY